jgi:ADP-heptose:LPS heptosyltransferase
MAAATLSRARAAVLPEGGLHHAAAAVGVKSIVIYGGYISPQQTGYNLHENIFTGGEPCGMRIPCRHCEKAMASIAPEMVMEKLKKIMS